jgi:hypothetical protein
MADLKISQLNPATTPLAGTEVLPIVQSGSTVKVAVSNLTAGRSVSATAYTATNGGFTSNTGGVHRSNSAAESDTISNLFYAQNAAGTKALNFQLSSTNLVSAWAYNGSSWLEGWAIATNGDLRLPSNNIVQGTAGKGINFTANTNAPGMTSELLNWYEEGTWTPGSGVGVATSVSGVYTRIGRQVTVIGTLTFPVQIDAGLATITGLPFTSGATASGGTLRYTDFGSAFFLYGDASATTIGCYSTAGVGQTYTSFSGKRVDFAMTYFV